LNQLDTADKKNLKKSCLGVVKRTP
jgi:hypothetical protein